MSVWCSQWVHQELPRYSVLKDQSVPQVVQQGVAQQRKRSVLLVGHEASERADKELKCQELELAAEIVGLPRGSKWEPLLVEVACSYPEPFSLPFW